MRSLIVVLTGLLLYALIVLAMLVHQATAAPQYQVIDLGSLGGASSSAVDINGAGQVVGMSQTGDGTSRPFLYEGGSPLVDLGTYGGLAWYPNAMNDLGDIVGRVATAAGGQDAFLYSGGIMTDLGAFGGVGSEAHGINNSRQIVGSIHVTLAGWDYRAFAYQDGVAQDLGYGPSGIQCHAFANNNFGQIACIGEIPSNRLRGYMYDDGQFTSLGTLCESSTWAWAINDLGQVAGDAVPWIPATTRHACLFENGFVTDLGTLGGFASWSEDINNVGQIVGQVNWDGTTQFPFLYEDGTMIALQSTIDPASGWTLEKAVAINDNGWIVGNGINPLGQKHAFLLVPEPPTLLLLITLGGLAMFCRRK